MGSAKAGYDASTDQRTGGGGGSSSRNPGGCYHWSRLSSSDEAIAVVTVILPLALFGLVGNAVVLVSIWQPSCGRRRLRRSTSTSVFVSTLAVSDSLSAVLCSVYELLTLVGQLRRDGGAAAPWPSGDATRVEAALLEAIQFPITWGSWTIVAIAFFRYRVVSRPDAAASNCTPSRAKKMAAVVTVLTAVLSLPAFFRFKVVERRCDHDRIEYDLRINDFVGYTVYKLVYSYIVYFAFSYVLPLGLLVLLSAKLIASLSRSSRACKTAIVTPAAALLARRRRAKVTTVTALIALVNVLCRLPSFAQAVAREEAGVGSVTYRVVGRVARTLLVASSAADCVLFSFISESFRWRLCRRAAAPPPLAVRTACARRSAASAEVASGV